MKTYRAMLPEVRSIEMSGNDLLFLYRALGRKMNSKTKSLKREMDRAFGEGGAEDFLIAHGRDSFEVCFTHRQLCTLVSALSLGGVYWPMSERPDRARLRKKLARVKGEFGMVREVERTDSTSESATEQLLH